MSLEFVNRICPNCKNPNYMVSLGDFSKTYKYKCMNCNRYFNDIDFEKEPLQPVWKEINMVEVEDADLIEKLIPLFYEKTKATKRYVTFMYSCNYDCTKYFSNNFCLTLKES